MIAGTLLVVLTGIFLPGILIEGQECKAVGEVQAVPAQYIASDSLLAKEASESLKLNDRIQLITGQWESETQEAYSYEMTLKDYEAAALARDSMGSHLSERAVSFRFSFFLCQLVYLGSIFGESGGHNISYLQCLLLETYFYKI